MGPVSLNLSDILNKIGGNFDINKALLVRHSKEDAKECYKESPDYLMGYTSIQGANFANGDEHLIVFMSHSGQKSKLVACYKINGKELISKDTDISNFPGRDRLVRDTKEAHLYHLTKSSILEDFEEHLVIDWGGATKAWKQRANPDSEDKEKKILSINSKTEKPFPGYENLILSYDELEKVVNEADEFLSWRGYLLEINAIYLIASKKTGEQYIGSSYSDKGLLGRWESYTQGKHDGGNKGIEKFLAKNPNGYKDFQFSILKMLSRKIGQAESVSIEDFYKKKLLTIEFGLNKN